MMMVVVGGERQQLAYSYFHVSLITYFTYFVRRSTPVQLVLNLTSFALAKQTDLFSKFNY